MRVSGWGGALVVASTARDGFFQQKLNLLTPSKKHSVDQSNGEYGEGKQLSEVFKGDSVSL